jgi:hypothetical protein
VSTYVVSDGGNGAKNSPQWQKPPQMFLRFEKLPINNLFLWSTVFRRNYIFTVDFSFSLDDVLTSVAEPHHFYAAPAPAPGKNLDAAPAPAPTLLFSKAKFLNQLMFKHILKLSCSYDSVRYLLLKILTEWVINCSILCQFSIPYHL